MRATVFLMTLVWGFSAATAAPADRPNLVLIFMDDQRYDAMSHMGHPFVQTPGMDRMAREGARASNAFVTTSLCMPARVSILTGQYVSRHNVIRNVDQRDVPEGAVTFPGELQKAGYLTAHFGKWHLGTTDGVRPGYDHWVSYLRQGRYMNQTINVNGRSVETEGHVDDVMTDHAIAWVNEVRSDDRPFCLTLAFKSVHSAFVPPARCADLYSDEKIEPPASFHDTLEDKPAFLREVVEKENHRYVSNQAYEDWVRQYNRTVTCADQNVGRLIDTLASARLLEDTVVIFTSDGGYYQGEHGGLYDKRSVYEPSIRVPMLALAPGRIRAGRVVEEMVLNIDIAPTLLDFAGVRVPDTMQGRSFKPLLLGEEVSDWRRSFLLEYFQEWRGFMATPTLEGVRTPHHKLVHYLDPVDRPELYDLKKDPDERVNRHDDPAYSRIRADLERELVRLRKDVGTADLTIPEGVRGR